MRLLNKICLVTGGAGGIGGSSARALAQNGAKVIISDINPAAGQQLLETLEAEGFEVMFIKQDVTREEDWQNIMEVILHKYGKLDVLLNNAGIALMKTVEDTSLEEWRRVMTVNLDSVFLGTRYAIKAMKQSGGGSIINISSVAGLVGSYDMAAYNASKGGVRLFTKSAALQCAKYNIRINSVHPGYIHTDMIRDGLAQAGTAEDKGLRFLSRLHPIGRMGMPEEIANGIVFLASDESSFMTGSELVIDGGLTAN